MPLITFEAQQIWVPSMSPKGTKIYLKHKRKLLLHGPRKTAKSNIAQNMLIQHCFRWDGAVAGIIVREKGRTVGSGCWEQITGARGILEREWFKADIGCSWAPKGEPRVTTDSKLRTFKITNHAGGISEVQLHTLARAEDVDKFKDSNFSMLYLVEADGWDDEKFLDGLTLQLRADEDRIPHRFRQIILDCNPPRIGQNHWLYKRFIKNNKGEYPPSIDPDYMEVGFTMDDNPFITQEEKMEIYKSYVSDQIELDRNWYGKWVQSRKGTAFHAQFEDSTHVIGDASHEDESKWTVLLPPPGCFEFTSGWDLGDAMNHACIIAARTTDSRGRPLLMIIDEIVKVGANYSIEQFAVDFDQKYEYWQRVMTTRNSPELQWRHWSDPASLRYLSAANASAAKVLERESKHGIELKGVRKGQDSVGQRATMLKRMLYARTVVFSSRCKHAIKMLQEITENEKGVIEPHDPMKHIFDALTYMLQNELPIHTTSEPIEERIISF